jgi:hypothetical protein
MITFVRNPYSRDYLSQNPHSLLAKVVAALAKAAVATLAIATARVDKCHHIHGLLLSGMHRRTFVRVLAILIVTILLSPTFSQKPSIKLAI